MKHPVILAAALALFAALPAHADTQPSRFTDMVVGQGPDVILIPGLGCSRAVWNDEVAKLKDRYRLHLIQVNGFGGAPARGNASGPVLQPTTDELHQYLVANHLTGAPIIGHSLGATMGLLMAQQHPDDVKRLMIVDSLPFAGIMLGGPGATATSVQSSAAKMRDKIAGQTQQAYAESEDDQVAHLVNSPRGLALAVAMAKASDHTVMARVLYDDMTTDTRPMLAKVKAKVTVVYAYDPSILLLPLSLVERLYQGSYAALPDKTMTRIDGSRHFIMYDQPEALDRAIKTFLK